MYTSMKDRDRGGERETEKGRRKRKREDEQGRKTRGETAKGLERIEVRGDKRKPERGTMGAGTL